MLSSNKNIIGKANKPWDTMSGGVSTAAKTKITKIIYFLVLFRMLGVIRLNWVKSITTIGSSNATPKANNSDTKKLV